MEFKSLSSSEAFEVFGDFGKDIGVEHMRQTYGEYWPRLPVEGERVYTAILEDKRVGWCAIRPDSVDPMAWYVSGIFNAHRGNAYSKEILLWASEHCSKLWGLDMMLFEISNHPLVQPYVLYHVDRIFKKKIPGEFVAGYINFPAPGYTIFGLKRGTK